MGFGLFAGEVLAARKIRTLTEDLKLEKWWADWYFKRLQEVESNQDILDGIGG